MIATARHTDDPGTERDRLLHDAAVEALSNSSYKAIRRLTCRVSEGEVEVHGTVPSFYLKQLAQSALLKLGLVGVHNRIEVRS